MDHPYPDSPEGDERRFVDAVVSLAEPGEDHARFLAELLREMIDLRMLDQQLANEAP